MSLLKNALSYLISGVVSQGIMFFFWLMLPWFLVPEEMGHLTIALFLIEILTVISMLGMGATLIRFAAGSKKPVNILIASLKITCIAFAVVVGLTYSITKIDIGFFSNTISWLSEHYILLLSTVVANVVLNLYQSYQLALSQAKEYALMQILRAMIYLVLGILLLVFLAKESFIVVAVSGFSAFLVILVILYRTKKLPSSSLHSLQNNNYKRMLKYGVPLMLYAVLGVGIAYTQRLILDNFSGLETLGIFSFFNVLLLRLNGLWSSLNKAWTPRFFSSFGSDREGSLKLLRTVLVLVCIVYPVLLVLFILVSEVFLAKLIFPIAYIEHINILYLLLIALLFNGIYNVIYPLVYYKTNTDKILKISAIIAVLNMGTAILFIFYLGVTGAALSVIFSSVFTMWVYLYAYNDWADKNNLNFQFLMIVTLLVITSIVLLLAANNIWFFSIAFCSISVFSWFYGNIYLKRNINYSTSLKSD